MSSFETCPKCSYPVPTGAVDCPSCGIVYAKYRDTSFERPAASATFAAADTFNPYAPPKSELSAPPSPVYEPAAGEIWRSGSLLVMTKDAVLPDRCVRCNRPAEVRLRRKLTWHHPLIYLTILFSLLVYIVIALIVRKRAQIDVPLCGEHERARKKLLTNGWLVVLGSIVLGAVSLTSEDLIGLILVAMFGVLVGLILVVRATQPVVPRKIDDRHVWLKKISPDLLSGLPVAPGHLTLG